MAGKTTATAAGLLLSGGLLLATACSSSTETSSGTTTTAGKATGTTATAAKGISIADPWCRATAETATAGACYMVISNNSSTAEKLTKVTVPSSVAAEAQLHETVMSGGGTTGTTMKMGTGMSTGPQAELAAYGHEGAADDEDGTTGTTMKMGEGTTGTTMGGMGGGAMQMQEVSSIEIPANGKVELKPGGYHIMLIELAAPLKKGETVELTLTFDKADKVTVQAPVRDA
ncbi:MAG: copper chaperone PCu(A)C [Acidimicrobiales bacterium]